VWRSLERSGSPCTEEADGSGAEFGQEGDSGEMTLGLVGSKQSLAKRFDATDKSDAEDLPRYSVAPT